MKLTKMIEIHEKYEAKKAVNTETTTDVTFSEALTAMKADHTVRCKRSR